MAGGPRRVQPQGPLRTYRRHDWEPLCPSHLASWSEDALSRTDALLKDAEMQKKRVPSIKASILEHNTTITLFALFAKGALRPAANSFLKMVFSHAKIASEFSMRHSHAATAST